MTGATTSLDDPSRGDWLRRRITSKKCLRRWYLEVYRRYAECLARTPCHGTALEIGSGGGFLKSVMPEIVTSDVLAYRDVDLVLNATGLPFQDGSLRFVCMLNVFHHISDVSAFLKEVTRCLKPGGRVLIVDQHVGWISRFILRYLHTECFAPRAVEWRFESTGPVSGANGALTWIVFRRDCEIFCNRFSSLELARYSPHTPLGYWLSGGLRRWSIMPGLLFPVASLFDRILTRVHQDFGSFVDVELCKVA